MAATSNDPGIATTTVDNLADIRFSGAELELEWVATEQLRFDLSLGYLENEIKSLVGGSLKSAGQIITTKNELPFAPKWSWNFGASYILPMRGDGELMTRLDWFHTDGQYYGIENTEPLYQTAYDTLNLPFTYRLPGDHWEFQLGARNLTSTEYVTSVGPLEAVGSVVANISRPRTIYATVRYSTGK